MARASSRSLHQAARELGSAGGKKGGPARAKALSSTRRSEIARKGALAKNAKMKKGMAKRSGK